jgi:hypothetical protein
VLALLPPAPLASAVLSLSGEAAPQTQASAFGAVLALAKAFPAVFGVEAGDGDAHFAALTEAAARAERDAGAGGAGAGAKDAAASGPTPTLQPLVDLRKALWPRLFEQLRRSARGGAESVYPALLPLLASVPARLLLSPAKAEKDKGGKGKAKEKEVPPSAVASAAPGPSACVIFQLLLALAGGLRNAAADEALSQAGQVSQASRAVPAPTHSLRACIDRLTLRPLSHSLSPLFSLGLVDGHYGRRGRPLPHARNARASACSWGSC